MIGLRYLEPRAGRDHGHVLLAWCGHHFVSLEIDSDGDVVLMYSDRFRRPDGEFRQIESKVWVFR